MGELVLVIQTEDVRELGRVTLSTNELKEFLRVHHSKDVSIQLS